MTGMTREHQISGERDVERRRAERALRVKRVLATARGDRSGLYGHAGPSLGNLNQKSSSGNQIIEIVTASPKSGVSEYKRHVYASVDWCARLRMTVRFSYPGYMELTCVIQMPRGTFYFPMRLPHW